MDVRGGERAMTRHLLIAAVLSVTGATVALCLAWVVTEVDG